MNDITASITDGDADFALDADDADFALTSRDKLGANGPDIDLSEFAGSEVSPLDTLSGTAQQKLKSFIERLERLHEDRQGVMDDIKEVMSEAKVEGFDIKIIRKVLKIRAMDKAKREEEDALTELYITALEQFVSG